MNAMEKGLAIGMAMLVVIFILGLMGFIVAIPVWFLWNWVMAGALGLPGLTYFQSWGLYLLCVILFHSSGTTQKD